jgi:DNA-binding winged helix-turn-helix (wHTH) protein
VALVTALGRWAGANAPTIVSIYLVMALGLAAWGGWAVGATVSVAAMLCFNYFFLPPLGALTIAEPANWVALLSFLAASTFASRLVANARRQADEAQQRRREVEALYDLCFSLFAVSQGPGVLGEAAARTLRALGAGAVPEVLRFPGLEIDRDRRTVVQDGREIRLTPTELAILELLASHAGRPVTLRQIIATVWKGAPATTQDTVRVHVGSLRRKLEPDPANPRYIGTEPWVGYRFLAEVEVGA